MQQNLEFSKIHRRMRCVGSAMSDVSDRPDRLGQARPARTGQASLGMSGHVWTCTHLYPYRYPPAPGTTMHPPAPFIMHAPRPDVHGQLMGLTLLISGWWCQFPHVTGHTCPRGEYPLALRLLNGQWSITRLEDTSQRLDMATLASRDDSL